MGQILKGLVLTGAWGCFDEFNRLEETTLSAISMQIQLIQNALLAKRENVVFLDQKVRTVVVRILKRTSYIQILTNQSTLVYEVDLKGTDCKLWPVTKILEKNYFVDTRK